MSKDTRQVLHIHDDEQLESLCELLDRAPMIGFDTEFMGEGRYVPKLCLIQLATSEVLAVVDPLAEMDLSPLWQSLASTKELIVHAGRQDLEIMLRECGALPLRVFDTQIAAAFTGHGESVGYSKLLAREFNVNASSSRSYSDWSRRPLKPAQLDYAVDDVRHLIELREKMTETLSKRGRLDWLDAEFNAAMEKVTKRGGPEERFRSVSGMTKLKGKSLAVLRELASWREQECERANKPRQRLVPDRVLIEIARRCPSDTNTLKGYRGMNPGTVKRYGDQLLDCVKRGLAVPKENWPELPKPPAAPKGGADLDVVAVLLDACVRSVCTNEDIAPRLVATRKQLESLALHAARGDDLSKHVLMTGFRGELIGDSLMRMLQGQAGIKIDPKAGYRLKLVQIADS